MTTSDLFDPPLDQPISSAVGSPVSPSRSPESALARRMTVRSGLRCIELSRKCGQLGLLVRMLLGSSTWNSTVVFLTWKDSATPAKRSLFRLVPSMPDTDGTEFGLWPTAITEAGLRSTRYAQGGMPLSLAVRMFPTPTVQDASNNGGPSQYERNSLPLNAVAGGSLNPEWVEWLMGYPSGWTDLGALETPSSPKSSRKSAKP